MTTLSRWLKLSEQTPPVSHLLRDKFTDRWFRIHSLPRAKRYADTETEVAELKRRHHELAKEVLGNDLLTVFVGDYSEEEGKSGSSRLIHGIRVAFSQSFNIAEKDDDDPYYLNVYAVDIQAKDSAFIEVIEAVASEELGPVLFFSEKKKNAVAPYDGGADVFIWGVEHVASLKAHFSSWLSERDDGL